MEEDSIIAHKFAVMQQQLEQKDRRIQELEEENHIQRKRIMNIFDNEYIPKQKVKDKIEKLRNDIKLGNCRYPYVEEHKIDILQELLGGDEKK